VTPSYLQIELSRVPRASCIYISACNQGTRCRSAFSPLLRLSDIADIRHSVMEKHRARASQARSARGPPIIPRSSASISREFAGLKRQSLETETFASDETRLFSLSLSLSLSPSIAAFTSRRFPHAELTNRAPVPALGARMAVAINREAICPNRSRSSVPRVS